MKTLLIPTEPHEQMRTVFQTALLVAKRFGSYMEGFPLRPAVPDYVPIDMVSGLTWQADEKVDSESVRQSEDLFQAFMAQNGVGPFVAGSPPDTMSQGWFDKAPPGDTFVSGYGRVFDLIVLGRPVQGRPVPSMATLEAALFESGRPILIAPPEPPTTLGETVVIAWNCSTETARSTAFAMPFLRRAAQVIVLTIEGWTVPGPTGEQMARSLRMNGIAAKSVSVPNDRRNFGETILAQNAVLGGDLLIKGAYTQSRLRQMIFGGATQHVLTYAQVPVLMAH